MLDIEFLKVRYKIGFVFSFFRWMRDMKYKCNELVFFIGRIVYLYILRGNI